MYIDNLVVKKRLTELFESFSDNEKKIKDLTEKADILKKRLNLETD